MGRRNLFSIVTLLALGLNLAGTRGLLADDAPAGPHDSSEIRKEVMRDGVKPDDVVSKLKSETTGRERFFLLADAYFAKLKKEDTLKDVKADDLKKLFDDEKQKNWISAAFEAWNWDAEKLIEWAEKEATTDEEKLKKSAATYMIEWLRTDPKVQFLMKNFPLNLKDGIRFMKAIQRDDKSAGKALAELVFSLDGPALAKFQENVEALKDTEPPFKGNEEYFKRVKWATHFRKNNVHSDKATSDFKTAFDEQKADKLKANKEFAEKLKPLGSELSEVAGFDETKQKERQAAQEALRQAMPSAASLGFYAESDPAKAIRDARALARVTSEGKVWLDLDASHPGYNAENPNKKQSLYLGDAKALTSADLDKSILGALKTLNSPEKAGVAGQDELGKFIGRVPNRLSQFDFGKDPAGRQRFAVPKGTTDDAPGAVVKLTDADKPPAAVYLAKNAPVRTAPSPSPSSPSTIDAPRLNQVATSTCQTCHSGDNGVSWNSGNFLKRKTPLDASRANAMFTKDAGMADAIKELEPNNKKALFDWVKSVGGTVPEGF